MTTIKSRVSFTEHTILDASSIVRKTKEGYLVAAPRVARIGIQQYRGSELGKPEMAMVRVYRPESEVFKPDSLASFAHRPITNDHPPEPVNSRNYKKYSVGQSDAEVARDGDFVRVPMLVMDEATIQDYEAGKAELSSGYSADLVWGEGKTPTGEIYDAMQVDITCNHIAIVDAARGGPMLRIGDKEFTVQPKGAEFALALIKQGKVDKTTEWSADSLSSNSKLFGDSTGTYPFGMDSTVWVSGLRSSMEQAVKDGQGAMVNSIQAMLDLLDQQEEPLMAPRSLQLDGLTIQVEDNAAQVIERYVKMTSDNMADLRKQIDEASVRLKKMEEDAAVAATNSKKDSETKDAKIATLEKQLKDSEMTPAKLDTLVKDRSETVGKAMAKLGDKLVTDGKTEAEIRRQVVDAELGDKAKGWSDDAVKASFDTLTAGIDLSKSPNNLGDAARSFARPGFMQVEDGYDKRDKTLANAWKTPQPGATQ